MDLPELLPCPFCGAKAGFVNRIHEFGIKPDELGRQRVYKTFHVECSNYHADNRCWVNVSGKDGQVVSGVQTPINMDEYMKIAELDIPNPEKKEKIMQLHTDQYDWKFGPSMDEKIFSNLANIWNRRV